MERIITHEAAAQARAFAEKLTGRTIEESFELLHKRLLQQIAKGVFNPQRWIPIGQVSELHARYGLMDDDDLIYAMVSTDILKMDNPRWEPPGHFVTIPDKHTKKPIEVYREADKACAVRLNPEKFEWLYPIYATERMR